MSKEKAPQGSNIEDIKPNKTNLYVFLILIGLFLIGIISRWDYISKELKSGFEAYFPPTEQVDSSKTDHSPTN